MHLSGQFSRLSPSISIEIFKLFLDALSVLVTFSPDRQQKIEFAVTASKATITRNGSLNRNMRWQAVEHSAMTLGS